jgi:hypothetical protein
MRKLMLASTVFCLIVVPAMGASNVWMEVEAGGSNDGATCAAPAYFRPGQTADGSTVHLDANGRLTWAMRLHASGTQTGGNNGEVRGVANFVFDLEIYRDSVLPANLVTTATFTSTANVGNCGDESDPSKNKTISNLSVAAFAYSLNIENVGATAARVFDPYLVPGTGNGRGGPALDVHCYPKTAVGTGKFLGMGAGYSAWNRDGTMTKYTTGGIGKGDAASHPKPAIVGCVGDPSYGCYGWGPVCEGQIENLTPGTYVLRIVPGGGVNVLRNEVVGTASREVFALAADTVQGDTMTFVLGGYVAPPAVVAWESIKTCGGTTVALPLNPTATVAGSGVVSESRAGGVQKIKVTFDRDISSSYTAGRVALSGGLSLVSDYLSGDKQSLIIDVSGSADMSCYSIDIVNSVWPLAAGTDTNCKVVALQGDVDSSANITGADTLTVKNKLGAAVALYPGCDITCDGSINGADMLTAKNRLGNYVVNLCP